MLFIKLIYWRTANTALCAWLAWATIAIAAWFNIENLAKFAEEVAKSITKEFPKHPFSWKVHGALLKQTGRIIESLVPMQKSVELAPQDAEAHNNLGNMLRELGKLDEAEASWRQAIDLKTE